MRRAEIQKQQDDLIGFAHFVLSPFIGLFKLLKLFLEAIVGVMLIVGFYLYQHLGWLLLWPIGLGSNGYLPHAIAAWERVPSYTSTEPLRFGQRYVAGEFTNDPPPHYDAEKTQAFHISPEYAQDPHAHDYIRPIEGHGAIPMLCRDPQQEYRSLTLSYDNLGPWERRADRSTTRKRAKMTLAIVRAQVMGSMLRTELAYLKFGGNKGFDVKDFHDDADYPYNSYYVCADSGPAPLETINSSSIHIDRAPVIGYGGDGMCVLDWSKNVDCEVSDLREHVNFYTDLFFRDPWLSSGQQKAVDALDYMSTPDFWLKTAHDNGIVGRDEAVLAARQEAFARLDRIMAILWRDRDMDADADRKAYNYRPDSGIPLKDDQSDFHIK